MINIKVDNVVSQFGFEKWKDIEFRVSGISQDKKGNNIYHLEGRDPTTKENIIIIQYIHQIQKIR